jgi:SAM-dependent methyltransferase
MSRACPVCDTESRFARLFLEENIDPAKLSGLSFASRKTPEFMCHRLVRCPRCDLVYADEPLDQEVLAQAYHASGFDSAEEANDAADSYVEALRPLLAALPARQSVLEIGAGTGAFLERLLPWGFTRLVGVEPSPAAIAAAPPSRRAWLREAIFKEEDHAAGSFDFVCCFMTLEHVRDPGLLTRSVVRLLKPGGAFAVVVHDHRSLVNRVLGRRSPIIDIEHMQLFSRPGVEHLFKSAGLERISVASFRNRYAVRYWLRLLPLSPARKGRVAAFIERWGIAGRKIGFNVGNMMCHGFRPDR